jgi:regulator of protease activity HflC (stomatin/prohibitin superfamily)
MIAAVIILVIVALVVVTLARAVRIVPQARAYVIERLGSYSRTLSGGFNTIVPVVDRVRSKIDLREQVVSFAPQPVITEDNLVVHIDTVLYFQVTDPRAATYEIANYLVAIEQLTVTTLRNVIGGLDLERTLTSARRSTASCAVLDEATGKWGSGSTGSSPGHRPAKVDHRRNGEAARAERDSGPPSWLRRGYASRKSSPRRVPSGARS